MKQIKWGSTVFAAIIATTMLVGCASTGTRESTGQYIDDTVITSAVKASIVNEPSLKVSEINVETYKGNVQLSGFVSSEADIQRAVEIARGVNGVKAVQNDMRLKPMN